MTLDEFRKYWINQEVNLKPYKIYKITNLVNNKCYIGYTKRVIIDRFMEHINYIQKGTKGTIIYQAIVKYGWENFKFEVLETGDNKEYISEIREDYWINYFNSRNYGYNLVKGGSVNESTKNTHIYNNGIHQRFIKEGNPIPEGFVKGALPKSIECLRKLNKKHPNQKYTCPANKGKGVDDPKVKENAINAKNTILRTKILEGACNPRALYIIAIDPTGKRYDIIGTTKLFVKEHKISYTLLKQYLNKGVVPSRPKSCASQIAKNTVGWIFILDDSKDNIKEAKKARIQKRLEAIKNNIAGRTQKNINKITLSID